MRIMLEGYIKILYNAKFPVETDPFFRELSQIFILFHWAL